MQSLKRLVNISAVLLIASLVASNAQAQSVGIGVGPWLGGAGSYGGGTAEGNYLSGLSQVIRAEGDYNLATSASLINYEQARSKHIENVNQWTQAYFQMREANQAFQLQKAQRNRHSPEALAQAAAAERPRTLTLHELDLVTGKITWPEALTHARYADLRNEIERLFEARARTKGATGTSEKVHDAARRMTKMLKDGIRIMPANDYIAARRFIDALDYAVVSKVKAAGADSSNPKLSQLAKRDRSPAAQK